MSWIEDMDFDSYDGSNPFDYYCKEDPVQTTKNGKEILIHKMTNKHLYLAFWKTSDERLQKEMLLRLFKDKILKDDFLEES